MMVVPRPRSLHHGRAAVRGRGHGGLANSGMGVAGPGGVGGASGVPQRRGGAAVLGLAGAGGGRGPAGAVGWAGPPLDLARRGPRGVRDHSGPDRTESFCRVETPRRRGRTHRGYRWKVVQDIVARLEAQAEAASEGDLAGFLDTVDPDAPAYRMVKRHWFEDLQLWKQAHPRSRMNMEPQDVTLLGERSALVTVRVRWWTPRNRGPHRFIWSARSG